MSKKPETGTPCIRCGKTRIFLKKWVDASGRGEPVTHEIWVCPDKDCRSIVEADFEAKRQKRFIMESNRNSIKLAKKSQISG